MFPQFKPWEMSLAASQLGKSILFPATAGQVYREQELFRLKVPVSYASPFTVTLNQFRNQGHDGQGTPVIVNCGRVWGRLFWATGGTEDRVDIDWSMGTRINVDANELRLVVANLTPVGGGDAFRVSAGVCPGHQQVRPLTWSSNLFLIGANSSINTELPPYAKRMHHVAWQPATPTQNTIRSLQFLGGTAAAPTLLDFYSFTGSSVNSLPRFPLPIPVPEDAWGVRIVNNDAVDAINARLIYELAF